MNKYAQYIKEREDLDLYEDDRGFFTYKIDQGHFQVNDLFVLPEYRDQGVGREYAKKIEELAKNLDCNTVYCFSCKDANNWISSHLYIMKHGYTMIKNDNNLVFYKKELK